MKLPGLLDPEVGRGRYHADALATKQGNGPRHVRRRGNQEHEIITHRYDHRKSMIITTNRMLGDDGDDDEPAGAGLGNLTLRQRLGTP